MVKVSLSLFLLSFQISVIQIYRGTLALSFSRGKLEMVGFLPFNFPLISSTV